MGLAFQFLVVTPPGSVDPSIAIAASRAGEIGVLDLEYTSDVRRATDALAKLERHARNPYGIKVGRDAAGVLEQVLSQATTRMSTAILATDEPQELQEQIKSLHQHKVRCIVETVDMEGALLAQEAGADAVIAKGHEAAGRVGDLSAFVFLQQIISKVTIPVYVHGGVGLHTAAACYAGGAAGAVLDSQMLLTRESPVADAVKAKIRIMDGSETTCVGGSLGENWRMYSQPDAVAVTTLKKLELTLSNGNLPRSDMVAEWRDSVGKCIGWDSIGDDVLLMGQDIAFAASLAARFLSVGGILGAMRNEMREHCETAKQMLPLDEGSPLAQSHGTRYPIVQGPMTRVSDKAEFVLSVADNGALPFIALSLMSGSQAKPLLEETQALLGDRPWGVGILGFVPHDLRVEQMEAIRSVAPPFAIIAGGRPDQAQALEQDGIPTYLHVPSPGLLKMFLKDGARRFIFEGWECGGHVGPRSSFVLWESVIEVLLHHIDSSGGDGSPYHILFAGGIHDSLSSSMVATLAASLAERGANIGVLMGTSYIFTDEAVSTGVITSGYQQQSVDGDRTVLLETGTGHSTRVLISPYVETFRQRKQELIDSGMSPEDIRTTLENLNVGRLRIATKGIERGSNNGEDNGDSGFVRLSEEDQHQRGTYMIGQVAALHDGSVSMADLHDDVSRKGSERLKSLNTGAEQGSLGVNQLPSEVAIVGMGCVFPGATNLQEFWENILNKVDSITEVPKERWDPEIHYDEDPKAKDKVYSKWGGFIGDVPFDPLAYGIPPNSLASIEPIQLITLEVVRAALEDAGYSLNDDVDGERTSVILGAGGGAGDLAVGYVTRSTLPTLFGDSAPEIVSRFDGMLPEWTEDSFAGMLMNVTAGRVANRFDFGGLNCTIDAACASSLAALHLAVKELETGSSDIVITGGVDGLNNPFAYKAFSSAEALSPSGRCRPYDAEADGIAISEGVAAIVLKRLSDAERDGDRIYGVIRGVGASSDGKSKGLTAPRPEGQVRALRRAYAKANVSPSTVGLIEGHGTGTVAGDRAEVEALTQFFKSQGAEIQDCALGSVKSMIGHTKCTAGIAGIIKVALALHHKVLPPTLGVETPNPSANFLDSPFYVNSESRPWINSDDSTRHGGISAFGFGGTNFHVVVEEYTGAYLESDLSSAPLHEWPSELFIWRSDSREGLIGSLAVVEKALDTGAKPELRDLAYTLSLAGNTGGDKPLCLAIVADSLDNLRQKLTWAREGLNDPTQVEIDDPRGIFFTANPLIQQGDIAFLFPGQGSQYVNMLRDLAIQFPIVRECFENADKALEGQLPKPLSSYIFPPPTFTEIEGKARQAELTQARVAQPGMGVVNVAMYKVLDGLGIKPKYTAGHSYGEFVALYSAGVFTEEDLYRISAARGRFIEDSAGDDPGAMAAIEGDASFVKSVIAQFNGDVVLANLNSPRQTVISGTLEGVEKSVDIFKQETRATKLPVAVAYHSPLVAKAETKLADFLSTIEFGLPNNDVFSNIEAKKYPDRAESISSILVKQLISPVRWAEEIEAMYDAGARIFVEVGPRGVLTRLPADILGDRPHLAVATDQPGRNGLMQLQYALGQLAAHGVDINFNHLYEMREVHELELDQLDGETGQPSFSATTWMVNGGGARPLNQATSNNSTKPPPGPIKVRVVNDEEPTVEQTIIGAAVEPALPSATNGADPGRQTASASEPLPQQAPQPAVAPQPASPAPRVAGPATGAADQVMAQFQQLMGRFLDTQKSVMLSYLQGNAGEPASWSPTQNTDVVENQPLATAQPIAAPQPVAPVVPAAPQPPPVAAPTQQEIAPAVPPPQPVAYEASTPSSENGVEPLVANAAQSPDGAAMFDPLLEEKGLTERLVTIVSERTGYPVEMIGLEADLEADLGIDSIKRVEILGTLTQSFVDPAALGIELETLSASKTLRTVIDSILAAVDASQRPVAAKSQADGSSPF